MSTNAEPSTDSSAVGSLARTRRWSDLTPTGKKAVLAAVGLHVLLVGIAHGDITKRPAEQIRGPKRMWRWLTLSNSSFTVLYFVWGRRKPVRQD